MSAAEELTPVEAEARRINALDSEDRHAEIRRLLEWSMQWEQSARSADRFARWWRGRALEAESKP